MITVWGRRDSSNVQAVMWCIGELGLDYERHDVGHRFGGTDTPEFIAMNPNRMVPVIRDGDGPALFESAAICRYLASVYGGGGAFWPEDPVARAEVDIWAEWAKATISPSFTVPIFWRVARVRPEARDWPAIEEAVAKLEGRLAIADARLGGQAYLAGDAFSLADIALGHLLYRYYTLPITRTEMPALGRYYARLQERAAYGAHVMVDYSALMPG